ncbi:MAG: hypothetical protein ABW004_08550 [Aeromicrobium sp.]
MKIHIAALAVIPLLLLAGCATTPEETTETPHGYVEGAAELAEPQLGLAYAEDGGETLHLFDLATEESREVALSFPAATIDQDERFVYVGDGGDRVEIIDTGVWTIDHGDHVHYYRADPRSVGVVTVPGDVTAVAGQGARAAITSDDGTVTILDRRALESGEVSEIATVAGEIAIPYRDGTVVVADGRVRLVDDGGADIAPLDASCSDPVDVAAQRSGVVISCDGAVVLVKQQAGTEYAVELEAVAAGEIGSRPRSNGVSIAAGDAGVLQVDVAAESLVLVPLPSAAVAAASPADDLRVLTVHADGTVRSSGFDGSELATATLPGDGAALVLDTARAYATVVGSRTVLELDYADGLRVAREFDLAVAPELIVEIGR